MEEYDLLQCIDKALDSFGSLVKNAIFLKLTMQHNSGRSEVLSDPNMFAKDINETFGSSARGIEMAIIGELKKKFSVSSKGARSLVDAMADARKQIISTVAPVSFANASIPNLRPNIFARV